MNGQSVLKNSSSGLYFVDGKGFTETNPRNASKLSTDEATCTLKCAGRMGVSATLEAAPQDKSYGVVYIRSKDVASNGSISKQAPDASLNELDPSKRRFGTFDEARVHGSRFHARRKNRGDQPGTANHRGFYIVEINDPVNSAVNPATGLTNSL